MNYEQHNTCGNADVGHIEDPGTETADAEVHEVDHATIIHDAIQEVAQSAAQHETPGNGGEQRYLLSKENHRQGDEAQGREYLERRVTPRRDLRRGSGKPRCSLHIGGEPYHGTMIAAAGGPSIGGLHLS